MPFAKHQLLYSPCPSIENDKNRYNIVMSFFKIGTYALVITTVKIGVTMIRTKYLSKKLIKLNF